MKSFRSFRLDTANQCLWRGQERVPIPPKPYDVLRYLVENHGRLVTPDEVLEKLWPGTYVNPEVLRKYILDIRKVLGDRPEKPEFIETVTKRGYRFIAPVVDESEIPFPDLTTQKVVAAEIVTLEKKSPFSIRSIRTVAIIPILVLAVITATARHLWLTRSTVPRASFNGNSIAVLPFVDISPAKDQEYFSDGLAEELITDLAKAPSLKVVARCSSFQFKDKNEDPHTIAQKLGVANILEGSVRKEGNRVRITAELIKADDGFQLWSETYDRDVSHIFAVQDEIARTVTLALHAKLLNTDGITVPETSHTTNSAAYEAYLEARYFFARGQTREDLAKALSYAEQVTRLDPNYAPAWAEQSMIVETMAGVSLIDAKDGYQRARTSAKKAIALDPKLATGYLALALIQIDHDWDWEDASVSVRQASLLAPNSAIVLRTQAALARYMGRVEDAIDLYKQAIALDPLRANTQLSLGDKLRSVGRYDEAKAALDKAEELNAQLSSLHLTRAQVLFAEGHTQEAIAEVEKETGDWEKLSGQALAYAAAGRTQESDTALHKLIAKYQYDAAYQIAQVYAYRGEVDKAFVWLDRAYVQRDPGIPECATDPLLKSLRADARYSKLLSKLHLPT
jgi:TolB-like protein/DNA-binding winged helix-turn-helix (wHTH) protein/Tfp pilus assembly protein PilF